jgi:hypothetical protein
MIGRSYPGHPSKIWSLQSSNRRAHLPESNRTLRDGSWADAVPGTSCQATIMLSLWDEIHSPRRGFD